MMARYIDADTLMKELEREVELADDWKTAHEIVNVVKYAPTVDVAPVKHAKWIDKGYGYEWHKECSSCFYKNRNPMDDLNYCPNCGAKMEEENEINDRH